MRSLSLRLDRRSVGFGTRVCFGDVPGFQQRVVCTGAKVLHRVSNHFVSHCREIVVFRQARNPGKLRNTVHCNDCTVRPGSGSAAQVARTIWSQRARAILIRLGDNNADCSVSPMPSYQRNMG